MGVFLFSNYVLNNFVLKNPNENIIFNLGSAVASVYYAFNYEQMTYYGGEFYQGFILINLTPIFLYFVLRYLDTPVKFGVWNRYLGLLSLSSIALSGGLNGLDAVGIDVFWFAVLVVFTLSLARYLGHNPNIRDNFLKKTVMIFIVTVLACAWILQALYYGSVASFSYATSTIYSGKPIITLIGSSNVIDNYKVLFSSGFYTQFLSFGGKGENKMWYSPVQYILSFPFLKSFIYIPVVLSFLYVIFIRSKWLYRRSLIIIGAITILFYLVVTQSIDTGYFSHSQYFIIAGINFSLSVSYSIYPFIFLTSISLAVSLDILQIRLGKIKSKTDYKEGVHRHNQFKNSILNSKKSILKLLRSKKLVSFATIFIIAVLILLFIIPIVSNPLEEWQYSNDPPISGVFRADNSFEQVGEFIEKNSPYSNILDLPITVSPFATMYNNSSFMSVNPPFSSFFSGTSINSDPGFTSNNFAYPILKFIPNSSVRDFSNFLSLLSIKYIVVNTAQYPTWVSAPQNSFNGGGPPWDFNRLCNFLNNSVGIELASVIGPYYIYVVLNTLPIVYLSSGIPANFYGNVTPSTIFNLYSNGSLIAGDESLIESTINGNSGAAGNGFNDFSMSGGATIGSKLNNSLGDHLLSGSLKSAYSSARINYLQRLSSTSYTVNVSAASGSYLILNEAFSIEWSASLDGKILEGHFLANDFANGWLLPQGNYTVSIHFQPQKIQNLLNLISIVSVLGFLSVLVADLLYDFLRKKLKEI